MTGWARPDRFLQADPRDVGREEALNLLHLNVDLVLDDATARRYPEVSTHLLACEPCAEDFRGLLLAAQSTNSTADR